jgi:putative Mg2+ transporter-C (MgtC) family protein
MFFEMSFMGSVELDVLVKLLLAGLAGGLVGLEREKHGRPAGLRTNLLVAVGSCVMVIVSEAFFYKYAAYDAQSMLRIDPSRVAAQIVTGVGFLGAGVILKEGASVRGLTTAASLWTVSGLGMAFGMGFFSLGSIATVLVLISLNLLKKLEPVIPKVRFLTLMVTATNRDGLLEELQAIFADRGLVVSDISSNLDLVNDELFYQIVITQQQKRIGQELTKAIRQLESIKKIHYH